MFVTRGVPVFWISWKNQTKLGSFRLFLFVLKWLPTVIVWMTNMPFGLFGIPFIFSQGGLMFLMATFFSLNFFSLLHKQSRQSSFPTGWYYACIKMSRIQCHPKGKIATIRVDTMILWQPISMFSPPCHRMMQHLFQTNGIWEKSFAVMTTWLKWENNMKIF